MTLPQIEKQLANLKDRVPGNLIVTTHDSSWGHVSVHVTNKDNGNTLKITDLRDMNAIVNFLNVSGISSQTKRIKELETALTTIAETALDAQ